MTLNSRNRTSTDAGPALKVNHFGACQQMGFHRHHEAYAALVLEGDYIKASLDGRFVCPAGAVVIHPAFHGHANEFSEQACTVVDLPLPVVDTDLFGYRLVADCILEDILRLAENDAKAAAMAALEASATSQPIAAPDWLARFVGLLIRDWPAAVAAKACGVSPAHASRATTKWFGIGPSKLRQEARIRRAVEALRDGAAIVEAVAEAGFSDQPHLTRTLKKATGLTPARLR